MEVKFSCDECSFQTRYKRNLESHKQTVHRREDKFECEMCEFSSAYHRNLVRHCKEVHNIEK